MNNYYTLDENNKLKRQNLFLMFLFIFLSSFSSEISRSPFGQLFGVVITLFYARSRGVKLYDKKFLMVSGIFVVIIFLQSMFNFSFHILFAFRIYISMVYAFLLARTIGYKFFVYVEDVVYKLAFLSIPLYLIQLVAFEPLFVINGLLGKLIPFITGSDTAYTSSFFFVMKSNAVTRNSGFMWEPGAFAAALAIPIMINFSLNKFKINKKLVVLLVALLSTLSTMGYLQLLVFGLYYLYNSNKIAAFISFPFLLMGGLLISRLDFMSNKIFEEYSMIEVTLNKPFEQSKGDYATSMGRMGSFVMDINEFQKRPFFGIGGSTQLLTYGYYSRIQRTNGLSDYLVLFGATGMILLLVNLYKSFKEFTVRYEMKGPFFFLLSILFLAFSNGVLNTPLFFAFQFYYLIRKD